MKLFIGIDGGGTHTTACLSDEQGRVIGRAEGGVGNPNHASDAELRDHFSDLTGRLFATAGAPASDCVAVFAGMAGVTCEKTASRIKGILRDVGLEHAAIGVDHDIRVALAGGLAGRPGIALIVGTGSSCYGRDAQGATWQSGGWGALIADEGSGYYLGRAAMTAAVRMADGRQPETALRAAVFQWLGITDVSDILSRIYEQELTRPQIAAFAPTLLKLASDEDLAALEILSSGAHELAQMVAANHTKLPTAAEPEIVITGGLGTADSPYRPMIRAAIHRLLPTARVVEPELDAAAGAAIIAITQHNSAANAAAIAVNMKGSS